jgi:hypothetical protein
MISSQILRKIVIENVVRCLNQNSSVDLWSRVGDLLKVRFLKQKT